MSNISDDTALLAFKAICSFVGALSDEFGNRHKPLKLYNRLASRTQITHDQIIRRHINIFYDFCSKNRDAILNKNAQLLVVEKLIYSEKVFINMKHIMSLADQETLPIIWNHLLTISALVDPEGKAKEVLISTGGSAPTSSGSGVLTSSSGGGEDFLTDIMAKIEKNVKPDATPMEAFGSIMQSGVFAELMSGLQNGVQSGKLDIGKMMGSIQGLVAKMGSEVGDDPAAKNALGMLSNMTTSVGNGQQPDMSGMMSMLTGMMAHPASSQAPVVPQNIPEQKKG